jgi:hypothetical protein
MQVLFIFFIVKYFYTFAVQYNNMKKNILIYFATYLPFSLVLFALNYSVIATIMFVIGIVSLLELYSHDRV